MPSWQLLRLRRTVDFTESLDIGDYIFFGLTTMELRWREGSRKGWGGVDVCVNDPARILPTSYHLRVYLRTMFIKTLLNI